MSDRDAFLRAIRESPEDDTPRLVFADWLAVNYRKKSGPARPLGKLSG